MNEIGRRRRPIAAAERGHIIQRVLVDGWSPARAAAAFEVEEKAVAAWVAQYRRHGMASLRRGEVAGERLPWNWLGDWLGLLRAGGMRVLSGLRRASRQKEAGVFVVLRQSKDDGRGRR